MARYNHVTKSLEEPICLLAHGVYFRCIIQDNTYKKEIMPPFFFELRHEKNIRFCICENNGADQLISAFGFAT